MRSILILLSLLLSIQSFAAALFEDDFEQLKDSKISARLSHLKDIIEIVPGAGVNGSAGLKVTYYGNSEGSQRIVAEFPLSEAVTEVSLSYDIKFLEDFQFVKGGKLHGVGPLHPITGGKAMKNSGWSSRIMFREGGSVATYLYDQNKTGTYGQTTIGKNFQFQKEKFYAVTLYTKLNDSGTKADGEARVYVNGKLIASQDHVLFWKEDASASRIAKFLFSTFHGGHDPTWSPKDKNGHFVDVHAIFDNFTVERGLKLRMIPGQK